MLRSAAILFAILPILALAACGRDREPAPADIETARQAASALETQLRARLLDAVAQGGAVAGIDACVIAAPDIAASVSAQSGMTVARTALRWRNPSNAPDAFETRAMESFLAALAAGADPATLEEAAIIGGEMRYMKPIMTGALCVTCHGADIPADVAAAIAASYPDDQATGFAPGDMRGAFTIAKRMEP